MRSVLILAVLIHLVTGKDEACQNVILYGDYIWYNAMKMFELVPELYNGKVQYEDEGKLFHLRHRDGQWQLIEQVDPSWYFGFVYGNEEFPYDNRQTWTFIDYEWFNYHPNPYFKIECADVHPSLWLREGICTGHAISSAIEKGPSVRADTCFDVCSKYPECVGFSISREGCVPLRQICLNPVHPTTAGFTYVMGRVNKALEGRQADQSSTDPEWAGGPSKVIDGSYNGDLVAGGSCSLTLEEPDPWWTVQLGQLHLLKAVAITNRQDCCSERILGITIAGTRERDTDVILTRLRKSDFSEFETCGTVDEVIDTTLPVNRRHLIWCDSYMFVRSVVIYKQTNGSESILSLCEVDVFAEKVEKYVYMDAEKVSKDKADEICADFINGSLVDINSNETLGSLNSFISEMGINGDLWISNTESPPENGIGNEIYYEEGELIFNAASSSAGATCTSSSSLPSNKCDQALDSDYMTSWAMADGDEQPWIHISFRYFYKIFRIQLSQRRFFGESFKDIELEFSEGEKILMSLQQRQGKTETDPAGHVIDVRHLDGLISNSLKIKAISYYSSKNNGFTDIKVLGRPRAGITYHPGECTDAVVVESIEEEELYSCDDICLNRLDCGAYVIYSGENITTTCVLLASCSAVDANITGAYTVILEDESGYYRHPLNSGCGYGIYVGYKSSNLRECEEWCDNVAECIAFSYNPYGSCELLKDRCREDRLNWGGNYYYERIGGARKKANGTYIGCFYDQRHSADLQENYLRNSQMTIDMCRVHCQINYKYFALLGSTECSCDSTFGEYGMTNGEKFGDECWVRCRGDSSRICGGHHSSSVYSVNPHNEECVSIQTYDTLSEKYGALFRRELCGRELHFICQRPNDFCDPSPCVHGGSCTSDDNGFVCLCTSEYEGEKCEKEIDECLSEPCLNDGSCKDLLGGYECQCSPGFRGVNCGTEINECSSNPCQHNATCNDHIDAFSCLCAAGFTGVYCEIETDECSSNPCGLFGQCLDDLNGYSCICLPGSNGIHCENDIDECASDPCQHNGTCYDRVNSYICDCPVGFHGDHCEQTDDYCLDNNCSYHGVCVNKITEGVCLCDAGWSGKNCEINVDDCKSIPCENHGTCVDGINNSSCLCHPGYSGRVCEHYIGNPSKWGEWGAWSKCSVSCGSGLSHRTRECLPTFYELDAEVCRGESKEAKVCGHLCPTGDVNCTRWSSWSNCEGSCEKAEQQRNRSCAGKEEMQSRTCKPIGCKREDLVCFKCEAEITGYDDVTSMCAETEKCGKEHTHCVYEYGFHGNTSVITTRCGHIKECSSVRPGSTCYSLYSLIFLGESASSEDVMAALHKTNSTCTLCCTSPKCNEGFLPVQDILSRNIGSALIYEMSVIYIAILCIIMFNLPPCSLK